MRPTDHLRGGAVQFYVFDERSPTDAVDISGEKVGHLRRNRDISYGTHPVYNTRYHLQSISNFDTHPTLAASRMHTSSPMTHDPRSSRRARVGCSTKIKRMLSCTGKWTVSSPYNSRTSGADRTLCAVNHMLRGARLPSNLSSLLSTSGDASL